MTDFENEMLDWAKDMFGYGFSDEELLKRLEDEIKMDIGLDEWSK